MNSAERDKGHLAVLTRRRYHAILAGGRACNALGPASQQAKHRRQHAILYQPPLTHEEWVNGGWYES